MLLSLLPGVKIPKKKKTSTLPDMFESQSQMAPKMAQTCLGLGFYHQKGCELRKPFSPYLLVDTLKAECYNSCSACNLCQNICQKTLLLYVIFAILYPSCPYAPHIIYHILLVHFPYSIKLPRIQYWLNAPKNIYQNEIIQFSFFKFPNVISQLLLLLNT